MLAAVIFGVVVLLSNSLAFPVEEKMKEDLSKDLFNVHEDSFHEFLSKSKWALQKDEKPCSGVMQKASDKCRIWRFLESYGYIPKQKNPSKKLRQMGAWKFAVWNGAKIGKKAFMSKALPIFERLLTSAAQKSRCGNSDIGEGMLKPRNDNNRGKRYVALSSWRKNTITYKFENFDNDLSEQVQRVEIARAFKLWADASPLTFSEVQGSANADINIKFVAGDHSDGKPFDGPGFLVAHAFRPEDGRIHFDTDDQFTTGSDSSKVNLFSLAAHEIGHALGLDHSKDKNSIMRVDFKFNSPNLALSQDDIDGIQHLYPSNTAGCVDKFSWCQDLFEEDCNEEKDYQKDCKKTCAKC